MQLMQPFSSRLANEFDDLAAALAQFSNDLPDQFFGRCAPVVAMARQKENVNSPCRA